MTERETENSFWDKTSSGQNDSKGGTGLSTTDMKSISTFSNDDWDITTTQTDLNDGYPFLSWQLGNSPTWYIFEAEKEEPTTGGGGGLPPGWFDDDDDDDDEDEDEEEDEDEKERDEKDPDEEEKFRDIGDHWAEDYITTLSEKCGVHGYTDEDGNLLHAFGPNNPVTRAELVKMIVECVQLSETSENDIPFSDVEEGRWYTSYILIALGEDWIEGYDDGTFRPNANINRVEALKIILLSKYTEEEISAHEHEESDVDFEDTDSEGWYAHYLAFAVSKGFVSGYADAEGKPTGMFGPSDNLTRAEAAKIIVEVLGL